MLANSSPLVMRNSPFGGVCFGHLPVLSGKLSKASSAR
jgi:hypothetical protein